MSKRGNAECKETVSSGHFGCSRCSDHAEVICQDQQSTHPNIARAETGASDGFRELRSLPSKHGSGVPSPVDWPIAEKSTKAWHFTLP